jgi:hypothetical protein
MATEPDDAASASSGYPNYEVRQVSVGYLQTGDL